MSDSGLNSDAKKLLMRLPAERGEELAYKLDYAQVRCLLSLAESISWRTRHKELPTWINDDFTLRDFADETIKALLNPIETGDCGDDGCIEYPATSTIIGYAPQNPMHQPDYTPPGYTKPPFYVFHDQVVNFGAIEGDVIVDWTSLTSVTIGQIGLQGLPRIRVPFEGIGQLELELLKIPQGGLVYITKDGSPIGGRWIDLSSVTFVEAVTIIDAILELGFDGTYVDTTIQEFNFDSPGSHYVDITFLPNVNTNVLLGFGGGLRSVRICNEEGVAEIIGHLRLKPGSCAIIQQFIGNTWEDVFDLSDCEELKGEQGEQGIQGTQGIQGLQGIQGVPGTNGTNGSNGTNGKSVELRSSGGFIQWRLVGDVTWINLIALSAITGPQGATGAAGATGATGAAGKDGTSNVYPALPTSGAALCNAADYITLQVRKLISDTIDNLNTFTIQEAAESLLKGGGWDTSFLLQMVTSLVGVNKTAWLAAYDNARADLVCKLVNTQLNKTTIIAWVNTWADTLSIARPALVNAINASALNGNYALWAAVGATLTTANCTSCTTTLSLERFGAGLFTYLGRAGNGDFIIEIENQYTGNYQTGGFWTNPNKAFKVRAVTLVAGSAGSGTMNGVTHTTWPLDVNVGDRVVLNNYAAGTRFRFQVYPA